MLSVRGASATRIPAAMSDLHRAAKLGPPEVLERLLAEGADPDAQDDFGHTPLHAAAFTGDPELVRTLLRHGANPRARDRHGVPALLRAVRMLRREMAELLLDAGAEVGGRDSFGATPLHYAAKSGRVELMELLVARGAELSAVDGTGRMPVQWAQDPGAAGWLLEQGAEHTLDLAVRCGGPALLDRWLGWGTPLSERMGDGGSLLGYAAEHAPPETVSLLLSRGARPDGETFDERTPLLRAIGKERVAVVEALLAAGADPARESAEGEAPLDACRGYRATDRDLGEERRRVAELLLAHGAPPTPQWAVVRGDPAVLERALAGGYGVDRRDHHGETAFHLAAGAAHDGMVRSLLEAGADPRVADGSGRTPLHVLVEQWSGWAGPDAHARRLAVARRLLEAGADPDARDGQGWTSLHAALRWLHTEGVDIPMVKLLLEAGARPDARDARGRTPYEVDLGNPMHHSPGGDWEETVRRRDAAVAEVRKLLEEHS